MRDFTQVFDAYAQFEESMISEKMEASAEQGPTPEDDLDLEMRLARLEALLERRPLLLNRCARKCVRKTGKRLQLACNEIEFNRSVT